jgi:hypothetical protein
MDASTVDSLMNEALLADLGDGLDAIADRIATVHDQWAAAGAGVGTLGFLADLLENLGWWRGRIDAAVDPLSGVL